MRSGMWTRALVATTMLALTLVTMGAGQMQPQKIILDTDMGGDIDDAFALALVLSCSELDLIGVTTVHDSHGKRAAICCKMLHLMGRDDVPVAHGVGDSDPNQAPWAEGFDQMKPVDKSAAELIVNIVNAHSGEVILVPIGPLTNVAAALKLDPGIATKLKGIVTMGGAAYVGYNLQPPPCPEHNIKVDIPAAQAVYASGIPITMCGLDCTAMLRFEADNRKLLADRHRPLTDALTVLYELWPGETPILFDPMAVCMAIDGSFCKTEMRRVEVDDEGVTQIVEGEPNVKVCTDPDVDRFLSFYIERVVQPE